MSELSQPSGGGVVSTSTAATTHYCVRHTQRLQRALVGPWAYSFVFLKATKCHQCEKSFGEKGSKKIRCRRCGSIHCLACASNRITPKSVITPFGRKDNVRKQRVVACDKCYLEDAFEQEQDEHERRLQRHMRASTKRSGPTRKSKRIKSTKPHEDSSSASSSSASNANRSSTKRQHVRNRTLDRYTNVLKRATEQHSRSNTLDEGLKQRMMESEVYLTKRQQQSHTRARFLRDNFFQGVMATEDDKSSKLTDPLRDGVIPGGGEDDDDDTHLFVTGGPGKWAMASRTPRTSRVDSSSFDDDELLYDNEAFEQALEESVMQLHTSSKALKGAEKKLRQSQVDTIKLLRTNLLKSQDDMINIAKKDSKKVVAKLKAHITSLQAALHAKYNEEEDLAARATAAPARRGTLRRGQFADDKDLEQLVFEEELFHLREQLALANGHLQSLLLEQYFPRCMQWKIRVDAGENMYVGIRDLEVEKLTADYEIRNGPEPGFLHMSVSNIEAVVGIYQLSIKGTSTVAKLLGGILTPTINRLDLNVGGNWVLAMRYEPGDEVQQAPRWVPDKSKSKFQLKLSKKVSGASVIRLPDRVIKWLASTVLPSLISESIVQNMPYKIGMFILQASNSVGVRGQLRVIGDMSPRVWRVPIVGATPAAELARQALGVSEQEAVILDHLLRGQLAAAAGFHKKAISLNRLYKWRLQYASHTLEDLNPLLRLIQKDAAVKEVPEQWFPQLLERVCDLATKPVSFFIRVKDVDVDIDTRDMLDMVLGLYLNQVESNLDAVQSEKARKLMTSLVDQARQTVVNTHLYFDRYMVPLLQDNIKVKCNGMLAGGTGGIAACSLSNLSANVRLPQSFKFDFLTGQAWVLSDGVVLDLNGSNGPRDGEYTLRLVQKPKLGATVPRAASPDAELTLRNTVLSLFPAGTNPGTVQLKADDVRGTMLLSTLLQLINHDWEAGKPQELQDLTKQRTDEAVKKSVMAKVAEKDKETNKLVEESKAIVSRLVGNYKKVFQAGNADRLDESAVEAAQGGEILPFLTDDQYDLHMDVRGVAVGLRKVKDENGEPTVRLQLSRVDKKSEHDCVGIHVRRDLMSLFEEITPDDVTKY